MRTQSYSTLLVAALGAADAFLLPTASSIIANSRRTTRRTSICSKSNLNDDDNDCPPTASDPEIFRRALLAERFRLEGRSSKRKNGKGQIIVAEPVDVEDFRALVETRRETEARNLADPNDVEDFRALMETRREAEVEEVPIVVEEAEPQETSTVPQSSVARKEEEEQQQCEVTPLSTAAEAQNDDSSSSSFAKQRALLETRLALERKRAAKPSSSSATIADASSIASIREETRLEANQRAAKEALRKVPVSERTVSTAPSSVPNNDASQEEVREEETVPPSEAVEQLAIAKPA